MLVFYQNKEDVVVRLLEIAITVVESARKIAISNLLKIPNPKKYR